MVYFMTMTSTKLTEELLRALESNDPHGACLLLLGTHYSGAAQALASELRELLANLRREEPSVETQIAELHGLVGAALAYGKRHDKRIAALEEKLRHIQIPQPSDTTDNKNLTKEGGRGSL